MVKGAWRLGKKGSWHEGGFSLALYKCLPSDDQDWSFDVLMMHLRYDAAV